MSERAPRLPQSKLSRKKVAASNSVVAADDPGKVRDALKAQDAAFRGALIDAIEAGLENIPVVHPNPLEGLPKRIAPQTPRSYCSSSSGWDFLPNREAPRGSFGLGTRGVRRPPVTLKRS